MKTGASRFFQRSLLLTAIVILVGVLTACTGRGGGYLPPGLYVSDLIVGQSVIDKFGNTLFTGQAPFGFSFSCEDKGGLNPPAGRLSIELSYTDKGTNPIGSSFGIHGIVDTIDPVLESQICSGEQPPPAGSVLIFLGRYRLTTSPPAGFPSTCPTRETKTKPLCRFEVIVRDNDASQTPSKGDFFSIKLSSVISTVQDCPTGDMPPCFITEFPIGTVFYARAGYLEGGNLTVK